MRKAPGDAPTIADRIARAFTSRSIASSTDAAELPTADELPPPARSARRPPAAGRNGGGGAAGGADGEKPRSYPEKASGASSRIQKRVLTASCDVMIVASIIFQPSVQKSRQLPALESSTNSPYK